MNVLVIHDPQVARHDLVLEARPGGDVYSVPVVGNHDHRTLEAHLERAVIVTMRARHDMT